MIGYVNVAILIWLWLLKDLSWSIANCSEDEERYLLLSLSEWSVDDSQTCQYRSLENHGCPVNGPAVSALKEKVAVVYYTEVNQLPEIKLCLSYNSGENFTKPSSALTNNMEGWRVWIDSTVSCFYLDKHNKLMTLLFDDQTIWPIWYGKCMINPLPLSASRKTGFPILESKYGTLYLAFTETKWTGKNKRKIKKIDIN